ncbi:DoxX family protein [Pantoea stewartii]|uniref:DoxX family protein n=1 Tax=Pantoea stewartii TaxID=66269 RepID=UPI001CF77CBF|nr:DoxX family protein [Pantoea stewartii]
MNMALSKRSSTYGAALLRITLGALFMSHGLKKLLIMTPTGTSIYFQSIGLPDWLAYLTMAIELGLGVALVLGIYARWLGLIGVPLLLGTIVSVHGANGFSFNNPGGGWEYPAMWAVMLVVLALIGDGAFAFRPSKN